MREAYLNEEFMKKFTRAFSLILLTAITLGLASCYFGSISDFSEIDIVGLPNELYNPSLELGDYQSEFLPSGWLSLDSKPGDLIWDNEIFRDEKKSIRVQSGRKVSIISEAFNINPTHVYYSRIFAKSKDKSSSPVTISFVAFDKKGKKVDKFSNTLFISDSWKPVNITTGFFKGSAVFGRLVITVDSKKVNPIWLDEAGCYKVYEIK